MTPTQPASIELLETPHQGVHFVMRTRPGGKAMFLLDAVEQMANAAEDDSAAAIKARLENLLGLMPSTLNRSAKALEAFAGALAPADIGSRTVAGQARRELEAMRGLAKQHQGSDAAVMRQTLGQFLMRCSRLKLTLYRLEDRLLREETGE